MATIVAITDPSDQSRLHKYLLHRFIPLWEAQGHRVCFHQGDTTPPPGDVAILHVDQTVIPENYIQGLDRYARVINGAVRDIRKRSFSTQRLREGEAYAGPVICKTDLNCGGAPERRKHMDTLRGDRTFAGHCRLVMAKLENRLLFSQQRSYRIFDSVAAVPESLWRDPSRVVEKFLPEQDARGYYLRTWLFLGDRESCSRVRAAQAVIKGRGILERETVSVPDALREWRAHLGFDYGKFDFAIREGEVVLFDVNRTPTVPSTLQEAMRDSSAHLAGGLECFLK
ncbi:MAG: hypothetical protein B7Y26_02575 [Hydrogenophilales bacterium 16-64-46]|nr:MAG: hypothetical protein B7Z32_02275 [Hydrogenophilales bacterium 12-64-13]OYZ06702.1 MAG: hypothetical protein B7Y26_02575 [Hydrogenophilales bacterium 16-64-46]OZA39411.1 MAG: hypothetical protein B7X87_03680 [Hydrogenophilales bacterium 17-64-34]HQT00966.1 hypothetical protein [Thiobacillus sp.]